MFLVKKFVMLALRECFIRLISNMHAQCGCVGFFFFPRLAVSFRQYTEEERVSRLLQSGTTSGLF